MNIEARLKTSFHVMLRVASRLQCSVARICARTASVTPLRSERAGRTDDSGGSSLLIAMISFYATSQLERLTKLLLAFAFRRLRASCVLSSSNLAGEREHAGLLRDHLLARAAVMSFLEPHHLDRLAQVTQSCLVAPHLAGRRPWIVASMDRKDRGAHLLGVGER